MFLLKNLKYTLAQSHNACLVLDASAPVFDILYANDAFLRFSKLDGQQSVLKPFFEVLNVHSPVLPSLEEAEITRKFLTVIDTKEIQQIPLYEDGLNFCSVEICPAIGEDDTVPYLIFCFKDMEIQVGAYNTQVSDILESITDGFLAVNESWLVTYWNKEAELMLKRPRAVVMGNNLWELFPEAINLKFYEKYHQAMLQKVSVHFEEYFFEMDLWLDVTVYPAVNGISIYFKDITENKKNHRLLLQAKEEYQELFNFNPLPNLVYDMETLKILDVNLAAIDHYGFSRQEFLAMDLRQIRPSEDLEMLEHIIKNKVKSHRTHQVLLRHKKKSGELIFVEVVGNSIMFNGKEARISLIIDVTEKLALERQRVKNEKMLRDTVERYKILSKATSDAIFDWDAKADVLLWGEGFKTLFGYEAGASYRFRNWTCLLHPADVIRVQNSMALIVQKREVMVKHEYRFLCADGSYKYVMDREFLIYNEEGELIRVIGSMQDITERINYIRAIEDTNDRLNEVSWMQSHIVRAPLARLMGLSALISHDENDPCKKEILSKLISSAKELDSIIRDIVKKAENI